MKKQQRISAYYVSRPHSFLRSCLMVWCCFLLFLPKPLKAQYTLLPIAGNDSMGYYGDGGTAVDASLYQPTAICSDPSGNLYIADGRQSVTDFARIRKIDAATGIITTIAGSFSATGASDSANTIAATNARFQAIRGLCIDNNGDLLFAENSHRIRRINLSTGMATTVAGSPLALGYSGDGGPATAALLRNPSGIDVDKYNNIFFTDIGNNVIRKIDAASGIITTIAGGGATWCNVDGIPATAAQLLSLYSLCLDTAGNIYYTANGCSRVRKIDAVTGIISTMAGNGGTIYGGDGGPATAAGLSGSFYLTNDHRGNIYVSTNWRIRRIDGITGTITTVAGNGLTSLPPDTVGNWGPATNAPINGAYDLATDTCGNVYFLTDYRVRAAAISVAADSRICGFKITTPTLDISNPFSSTPCGLTISPNPSAGKFTLTVTSAVSESVRIHITDITGRVLQQFTTRTNKESPLELKAPPGLYIATASTQEGRVSAKIIVQ